MFTGIIEEIGTLTRVEKLEGGARRLTVRAQMAPELRVDESVSLGGACQTVVAQDATTFSVVSVPETLRKTTFGDWQEGDQINLERALRAGARLDGHFVQGHVDTTGEVVGAERDGEGWLYRIAFPEEHAPYVIPVGSIAIDGISLTVARLEGNVLTVAIIPHTYEHTTVSAWQPGRRVNLEFDMLGKYVVRAAELAKQREAS